MTKLGNSQSGPIMHKEPVWRIVQHPMQADHIRHIIYMAGSQEIGGFFRINEEKDEWSSLNTKGMAFSCLCLHKMDEPHEGPFLNCVEKANLVRTSFKIAKIAALAAAREAKK